MARGKLLSGLMGRAEKGNCEVLEIAKAPGEF